MAPLIIAHRTCPTLAPENSLEGLALAGRLGADGVEIDLRLSLDGHPYLWHDWRLRRLAGWPLPMELTPSVVVRRLHRLDSREPIASLDAALAALPPDLLLAVDVKTPWLMRLLLDAVEARGWQQRVLVWCTSARAVRYAVRRAPSVEVAYLKDVHGVATNRRFLAKAHELGAQAVSAHWQAIDSAFVTAAHDLGLRVYAYNKAWPLTAAKLAAGLDGLITDDPVAARAALAAGVVAS